MNFRTDLTLEIMEALQEKPKGVETEETVLGNAKITRVLIKDEEGERKIGRSMGTYVTVEVPPFSDNGGDNPDAHSAIKGELTKLLPKEGTVLVVGIGNTDITPDAFGPITADRILATRHITGEFARSIGLEGLRSVAVISPNVLGKTGLESYEIIKSITAAIKPSCVICIDALASRSLNRLGCTVQLADSGMSPGSGVGNKRKELSEATLGVKVISMGVPTVVDAQTMVNDLTGKDNPQFTNGGGMIVTPREIDLLIDRAAQTVSHAVNCALQPNIKPDILLSLV